MVNWQRCDAAPPKSRAGCTQIGEDLWRSGEQPDKGARFQRKRDSDTKPDYVQQALSITIEEQDVDTWWIIVTMAYPVRPPPWHRNFLKGFEEALFSLLVAPTQKVHARKPWKRGD